MQNAINQWVYLKEAWIWYLLFNENETSSNDKHKIVETHLIWKKKKKKAFIGDQRFLYQGAKLSYVELDV